MRYSIFTPSSTIDPRRLELRSYDEFKQQFLSEVRRDSEEGAIKYVRETWPDAVVVPTPVKIGSGTIIVLGVLPNIRLHHNDIKETDVPFVALVHASAESDFEQKRMRKAEMNNLSHRGYNRGMWRVPVDERGVELGELELELRSTSFDTPVVARAKVNQDDGRIVIFGQFQDVQLSMAMDLEDLHDILGVKRDV